MSEESEERSFKRLADQLRAAAKEHPIVRGYRQKNLKGYQEKIESCLQKKCYIEAFCIADQYVTEILQIFLNFTPQQKEKEHIDVKKILKLLQQIYVAAEKFAGEYKRFDDCRNQLVHEITRDKTIRINKNEDLEKICLEITIKANIFFEEIMAIRVLPFIQNIIHNKEKMSPESSEIILEDYKNEIKIMINYAYFVIPPSDLSPTKLALDKIISRMEKICIKALEKPLIKKMF